MIVGVSSRVIENHVGGNSRYVFELQRHLPAAGVEYRQIHPNRLRLPGRPGLAYMLAETAWPLLPSAKQFDVIHYPADTGALFSGHRVPIVATIHGMASRHIPDVRSRAAEKVWRGRVGRAAATANQVITVSYTSADDLMAEFNLPASMISVIPHGIDHGRFHSSDAGDKSHLDTYELPDKFCLYLGNLDPRKNILRLIQAFESNRLRALGARLVIAGSPAWNAGEILDAIRHSGHVDYLGPVPEDAVAPLMRAASVFAFPSLYEGFGFPVLEAMASGTPVVCSSRGSLREVAGSAAALVDPLNVDEIASSIAGIWADSNTASQLREAGLANAAKFDWTVSAAAHRDCFQKATSGS